MNIVYSKENTHRKPEYQVRTVIREEQSVRTVRKEAMTVAAQSHVEAMVAHQRTLASYHPQIRPVEATLREAGVVEFPYVEEGAPMGELLTNAYGQSWEEFEKLWREYTAMLRLFPKASLGEVEAFHQRFGNGFRGQPCIGGGCLDLNLDNVYHAPDHWILIDYEWIFPCALPLVYLELRALTYWFGTVEQIQERSTTMVVEALGYDKGLVEDLILIEYRVQAMVNQKIATFQEYREKVLESMHHVNTPPPAPMVEPDAQEVWQQEKEALEAQCHQMRREKEQMEQEVAEIKKRNAALEAELSKARQEMEEAKRTQEDYRRRLVDIEGSLFWKATTPLRSIPKGDKLARDAQKGWKLLRREGVKSLLQGGVNYLKGAYGEEHALEHRVEVIEVEKEVVPLKLSTSTTPTLSILIPVYNNWIYTYTCLASLYRHPPTCPYEVIIADDGSTDETTTVGDTVAGVRVVHGENVGFLRNVERGMTQSKGAMVLLLNNDTVLTPGAIDAMVARMDLDDRIGLVGAKLLYPDGVLQEAGGIVWKDGHGWNYGRGEDPREPQYSYYKEVDYCSGAALLMRTAAWKEVGGFDERFAPAYYEDTDLAFAMREAGYKVVYEPRAEIVHFEGRSHGTDESTGLKAYQVRNRERFVEKWKETLAQHYSGPQELFLARNGREKKPIMVVIDHYVVRPDQDAGSRTTMTYMELLLEMGYRLVFVPDNFAWDPVYTRQLEHLGIEVLYGPTSAAGYTQWWQEHGSHVEGVLVNRPHIAVKHLETIRATSDATVYYYGHDIHYQRMLLQRNTTGTTPTMQEIKAMKQQEEELWKHVDVVCYPSASECAYVQEQVPGARVVQLPLYVYEEVLAEGLGWAERRDLLFVGNFAHSPNRDALQWWCDVLAPMLHQRLPAVRLRVIGGGLSPELLKTLPPQVDYVGQVSDAQLTEAYSTARVVVAPLRYGAGVKGKVVQAWWAGVPVITTPTGVEGVAEGAAYSGATIEAEDFVQAIVEAYEDEHRWKMLQEEGRNYIRKDFRKQEAVKMLTTMLHGT